MNWRIDQPALELDVSLDVKFRLDLAITGFLLSRLPRFLRCLRFLLSKSRRSRYHSFEVLLGLSWRQNEGRL